MSSIRPQTDFITLEEIAGEMANPDILMKMLRGFFERAAQPYPDVEKKVITVSCVDSRLPPASVLGHVLGEAYSIQTIANVVPKLDPSMPLSDQSIEVAAGLQYALDHVGVKEIFVMGHTHCGGAEARYLRPEGLGFVNSWMSNVSIATLQMATRDFKNYSEFEKNAILRDVEKCCLQDSVARIKELPFIRKYLDRGFPIAGLICDLEQGLLDPHRINMSAWPALSDLIKKFQGFKTKEWGPGGAMPDLVANGQHPKALIITGISPYVAPENVFGIEPGDAFVHRRLGGNYHMDRTPGGLSATIQFAVAAKHVGEIILVAHRNDVNRDYAEGKMDKHDLVKAFMEQATPELAQWSACGMDPAHMHENSLRSSFFNVHRHPDVQFAVAQGKLSVTAIIVDHETRTTEIYAPRTDRFLTVRAPA